MYKLSIVLESTCNQVLIGFSFVSDWFEGWRKNYIPFRDFSCAKPIQPQITMDTDKNKSKSLMYFLAI